MILFFGILLGCLVTAVAIVDDWHGDKHPNKDLMFLSVVAGIAAGVFIALDDSRIGWQVNYLRHLFLSLCIYVSTFPYLINVVQARSLKTVHKIKWWDYLSATAWPDRTGWWKATPWYGRMFLALWVLALGLAFFVHPCWFLIDVYKGCKWYVPKWY